MPSDILPDGAGRVDPEEGFSFVKARQAEHVVGTLCRVLELSRSRRHAPRRCPPSSGPTSIGLAVVTVLVDRRAVLALAGHNL